LTIAIPTFDRPAALRRTLSALRPQLTDAVHLLVLDNCSPTPVVEAQAEVLAGLSPGGYTVVRHPINIGGDANAMRCFELAAARAEWVWVLGDDDLPTPDAVRTLLADTQANPDCFYLNYASELHPRAKAFDTHGRAGFIAGLDSFTNALFVSTCCYHARRLAAGHRAGMRALTSMAPQLAGLLAVLEDDGRCHFSDRRIVRWEPAPPGQKWSALVQAMSVMTLLDPLADHRERRALAGKALPNLPSVSAALVELLDRNASGQMDRGSCTYWMDQLCHRSYGFAPGPRAAVARAVARLLVRSPRLARRVLRLSGRRAVAPADWAARQ
jgi:hypothetical protein